MSIRLSDVPGWLDELDVWLSCDWQQAVIGQNVKDGPTWCHCQGPSEG